MTARAWLALLALLVVGPDVATWACDKCGAINGDNHVTCWKCGA